jgi:hypothetical protein
MAEEIVVKVVFDTREGKRKLEQDLDAQRKADEAKELAHRRRLEAIHLQSGVRLQQIEARRQAQLDAIRERGVQKEIEHARKLERETQRGANVLATFRTAAAAVQTVFAALAAIGIVSLFERFGRAAVQAAIDVNKQVNALKALTGSAEAAERRFAALFAIAQKTPGLTTNLAATLDAQLRVFSVSERTIDRLLPAIGRLNAISPLTDPRQFVNNFTQLISQNFERQDLKELVGQSPIAGLLIKEIFDVDNPTNAAAIRTAAKRLGITTVERLAEEFADAAATNSALRNATESFAGQFEKLQDRITVALAPVGEEILKVLLPAFGDFVKLLERDLPKITALLRDNADEFRAIASAIVTIANAVGTLIGALAKLDQKFDIIRAITILGVGVASPGAAGALLNTFELQDKQRAFINAMNPVQRRAFARATGNAAVMPSNEELRAFAKGSGDFQLLASLPKEPPTSGGGGGGLGGGGGSARSRFIPDFGLGDAAKLEHEAELARIRRSNLAVVLRRQQPFDLQALPRLSALAPGLPDTGFPGGELEALTRLAAEVPAKILPIMSDVERFMRGFSDSIETVGDSFERFGANVAHAFTNVRTLFDGLKRAVLSFFNDLLGSALQNLVRSTLGGLFGGGGGSIGNLFGNLFRGSGGGSGISAPSSISQSVGSFFSGGGGGSSSASGFGRLALDPVSAREFGGGSFLGGIGRSFGAAAPLLGLSLGAGLGGQSVFGQIAGSAGGLLAGGLFGAKVGAITGKAAAFFTNPLTAIIGGGLLIGSFLFGRSKQRRQDEELSGQFLTQALAGIDQLAAAVSGGQITTLAEARSLFDSQVLGTFRQQIGSLKTKSVRESRLTNQVRDLQNVFQARIPPLIADADSRRASAERAALIHSRLIPEFNFGGTVPGIDRGRDSVLAMVRPGEKILTRGQQSAVIAQSNPGVFDRAGVPRGAIHTGGAQAFGIGGTAQAIGRQPIVINVAILQGRQDATRAFTIGSNSPEGHDAIVNIVQDARLNKELN